MGSVRIVCWQVYLAQPGDSRQMFAQPLAAGLKGRASWDGPNVYTRAISVWAEVVSRTQLQVLLCGEPGRENREAVWTFSMQLWWRSALQGFLSFGRGAALLEAALAFVAQPGAVLIPPTPALAASAALVTRCPCLKGGKVDSLDRLKATAAAVVT